MDKSIVCVFLAHPVYRCQKATRTPVYADRIYGPYSLYTGAKTARIRVVCIALYRSNFVLAISVVRIWELRAGVRILYIVFKRIIDYPCAVPPQSMYSSWSIFSSSSLNHAATRLV